MEVNEPSCAEVAALRGSQLDGDLSPGDAAAVAAHVSRCPTCSSALAELALVDRLLRTAPVPLPTDAEWDSMVARARRPATIAWPGLAAAALVAVALPLSLALGLDRREAPLAVRDVVTPGIDLDF